jgi:arylsulfatase A-like enzyme
MEARVRSSWNSDGSVKRLHARGLWTALLLSSLVLVAALLKPAEQRIDRPNIVLFITDDESLGSIDVMPNLRSWLVEGGRSFKPGLVTTPMCCPSRASIFSGRYIHNHGVLTNDDAIRLDSDSTVQRYLSDAGYHTGIVGKYLNRWPTWRRPPHFDYSAVASGVRYEGGTWTVNGDVDEVSTYSTEFIGRHVEKFLESSRGRAWFLVIATAAPHFPAVPEPSYARVEVPPSSSNPAMADLDRSDKLPIETRKTFQAGERFHADQLRTMMSVDDLIGDVDDALQEREEKEETLALYISDNGLLRGEHGLTGKGHPLRPAVEVPFHMAWPQAIEPGRDDRLAANIDIAPTILDAAKISAEIAPSMDGRSLLDEWRRSGILLEYERGDRFASPSWASIRSRDVQYIEYYDDADEVIFRELYDLVRDEWQLTNLLARKRASGIDVSALSDRLQAYRSCSGRDCP